MGVGRVELTRHGPAVLVTLERPPVNALTLPYLREISATLGRIAEGDAAALVLTGAGTTFSAGLDLREVPSYGKAQQTELVDALNETLLQLYSFPVPTVAAMNGHAVAGGLLFALCCDYRIALEGNYRFGLAEVRVGIPYPVNAMAVVKAELSHLMARELALLGRNLSARQALARGVVDELCEKPQLPARSLELAVELARYPREAFARVKRQLRGEVIERMQRAVAEKTDPARERWITPETAEAVARALRQ